MNSPEHFIKNFLADDDLLYQVLHHYVLEREDGWCDIYVCRDLAGPEVGAVFAIPKLTWRPAHEDFYGQGRSEEEALRDCLQKLKGVPHAYLFPHPTLYEHQEENGPLHDTAYEDNGHLPKWY